MCALYHITRYRKEPQLLISNKTFCYQQKYKPNQKFDTTGVNHREYRKTDKKPLKDKPDATTAKKLVEDVQKTTFTNEELHDMTTKKDCTGYKPAKRIQSDISLYLAKIITDVEAQNHINQALIEWRN